MFEVVPVEREPEGAASRIGRRALGVLLSILGVAILLLFLRATVTELMDGTVFGLCICIMMLFVGVLLTRDGIALTADRRVQLRPWE